MEVNGIVTIMIERKDGPIAAGGDFFENIRVTVVGLGLEVTAKGGLGIYLENGTVELMIVADDKRFVIAQEFGKNTAGKENCENNQTVIAPFIGFKEEPASFRY